MGRRKSSQPAATSARQHTAPKYASLLVGSIIDGVIAKKLSMKGLIKPKTSAKWLAKLKLSILRKVSKASTTLFLTEDTNKARLESQIQDTEKKIQVLTRRLSTSAAAYLEKKRIAHTSIPIGAWTGNLFTAKVSLISEKIRSVAEQLSAVTSDLKNREGSMGTTVNSVYAQFDKLKADFAAVAAEAQQEEGNRAVAGVKGKNEGSEYNAPLVAVGASDAQMVSNKLSVGPLQEDDIEITDDHVQAFCEYLGIE